MTVFPSPSLTTMYVLDTSVIIMHTQHFYKENCTIDMYTCSIVHIMYSIINRSTVNYHLGLAHFYLNFHALYR